MGKLMSDQETISVYDSQIDSYLELVKKLKPDPLLLSFIKCVKAGGYVLDLGCGPANSSVTMREHGLRVDPVDASAEMVKLANESHNINARVALFSDINTPDTYDGVWANFSLLHAPRDEFPALLANIALAMRRGGVLHLGMKIGEGSKRDSLGRLYSYYSETELTEYLQALSFSVEHIKHARGTGLAGNVEPWIMLRAALPA